MALNFLSKHGIIIGIVTGLASLLILLSEMVRIKYIFVDESNPFSFTASYKVRFVGTLLLALLAAILSALLIVGIVKKRHLLMAPWLVVAFLLSVFISYLLLYETVTRTYFRWDNLVVLVILIGTQIIILYPICQLFTEIRSGYAAIGNAKATESNYVHNIQTNFDEISQKSMV